jgi:hypothetical protein
MIHDFNADIDNTIQRINDADVDNSKLQEELVHLQYLQHSISLRIDKNNQTLMSL